MEHKPLISIIIPAYNAEKSISRCLNSVLNQSYPHFEALVINDGSKDGTGQICDEFGIKDSRIKVFHKVNGGVSSARNIGLEQVSGEFICFLDSDDWLEPDYFEQFVKNAEDREALILFNPVVHKPEGSQKKWNLNDVTYTDKNISEGFIYLNLIKMGWINSKFYSSALVKKHQLKFDEEVHYGEDLLFTLEYINYIKILKYLDYAGYNYTQFSPDALSKRHNSFQSEYTGYKNMKLRISTLMETFNLSPAARENLNRFLGDFFLRCLQSFYRSNSKVVYKARIAMLEEVHQPENLKYLEDSKSLNLPTPINISIFLYKKKWLFLYDQFLMQSFNFRRLAGGS
jgi:glycosyltransferase involved in cell wall biosynthesis